MLLSKLRLYSHLKWSLLQFAFKWWVALRYFNACMGVWWIVAVQRESVWIWGATRGDAPLQLKCTHIYIAIQGWWLVFIHCRITMHFYHLCYRQPIPASYIFSLDKVFISYGGNCYQNSVYVPTVYRKIEMYQSWSKHCYLYLQSARIFEFRRIFK